MTAMDGANGGVIIPATSNYDDTVWPGTGCDSVIPARLVREYGGALLDELVSELRRRDRIARQE